jgi:hypothetical protein
MEDLSNPRIWLAAFVIAIIVGSAWQLDEPSETDVMQQVASNKQADKLVLAGQP